MIYSEWFVMYAKQRAVDIAAVAMPYIDCIMELHSHGFRIDFVNLIVTYDFNKRTSAFRL